MSDRDSIDEDFFSARGSNDLPRSQFGDCSVWRDEESDNGQAHTALQSLRSRAEENVWREGDEEQEGPDHHLRVESELDSAPRTVADDSRDAAERMPGAFPGERDYTACTTARSTSFVHHGHEVVSRQEELLSGMGAAGTTAPVTGYPIEIAAADIFNLKENRWETATAVSEVASEPAERDPITYNLGAQPRSATDGQALSSRTERRSAISFEESARHPRHVEDRESRAHRAPRSPRGPRPSRRHRQNREYSPPNLTGPVPAARRNNHSSGRLATPNRTQMDASAGERSAPPLTRERSGRRRRNTGPNGTLNPPRPASAERRPRSRHSQPGSTVRSDSGSGSPRFRIPELSRPSRSKGKRSPKYRGFCWDWRPFRRGH